MARAKSIEKGEKALESASSEDELGLEGHVMNSETRVGSFFLHLQRILLYLQKNLNFL